MHLRAYLAPFTCARFHVALGYVSDQHNCGAPLSQASYPPCARWDSSVDIHVGRRVRERRTAIGLSDDRLAELARLSARQIQRYERGAARIAPSSLLNLAQVLGVSVDYFFENLPGSLAEGLKAMPPPEPPPSPGDQVIRRETLELVRAYQRITNPGARREVYDLAQALAQAANG